MRLGSEMHHRVDVVQTVFEVDRVAALFHVTGRHTGDALGGKSTGRSIDFSVNTLGSVEDGKIVEAWNTFDFITI